MTLRNTSNDTAHAFLKELNGYPIVVASKSPDALTFKIDSLTTQTGDVAAIGGDDATQLIGLGFMDIAHQLVLGADSQAGYRSMLIRAEGGNHGGSRSVAEWQFYKVKMVYGGSVDYDRTGAVTYPVTAHCLSNSSDVVGRFITPSTYGRSNDYGDT